MTVTAPLAASERYLLDFEARRRELPVEPARLGAERRAAIERFAELGLPGPTWEDWRFTNVAPIAAAPLGLAGPARVEPAAIAAADYPDCELAVVVNGRFAPELSRLGGLPAGVTVGGLASTLALAPDKVEPHLGRHARWAEHPFAALNTAFFADGLAVHVPRGVVVERPINVLVVSRPGAGGPAASYPRLLVVAEESAQVKLVEQYLTAGAGRHLCCPVTEIVAGANAVVEHYKMERDGAAAWHLASFALWLGRDAQVSSHCLSWGGEIVRTDLLALLAGTGGDAILNGLYLAEASQLVDFHMRVEHAAAHCGSHELFKGILEGRSRAVFSGRIYVHPGAQKTDAKQTNRNLLLSREALVNSNPQLEIFADDVKCTHGSTVGQLDADAVFYLRSRGIGEEAAKSLLTYAFAADIVERVRIAAVRRDLEEFLFRRLPKGDIVRQAL